MLRQELNCCCRISFGDGLRNPFVLADHSERWRRAAQVVHPEAPHKHVVKSAGQIVMGRFEHRLMKLHVLRVEGTAHAVGIRCHKISSVPASRRQVTQDARHAPHSPAQRPSVSIPTRSPLESAATPANPSRRPLAEIGLFPERCEYPPGQRTIQVAAGLPPRPDLANSRSPPEPRSSIRQTPRRFPPPFRAERREPVGPFGSGRTVGQPIPH